MTFLVSQNTCSDIAVAGVLLAVKNILNLIQLVAPIILMIMLTVHFITLLKNPDDKKGLPKIKHSIVATVVIFLIPVITNTVMYLLDDTFTISDCWNNVSISSGSGTYIDPTGESDNRHKVTIDPSEYEK